MPSPLATLSDAGRLALAADLRAALIEQVAGPLEEQHAEDVFLVLAGVHVAAQVVARGQQQAFKAGEGQLGVGHGWWWFAGRVSGLETDDARPCRSV